MRPERNKGGVKLTVGIVGIQEHGEGDREASPVALSRDAGVMNKIQCWDVAIYGNHDPEDYSISLLIGSLGDFS